MKKILCIAALVLCITMVGCQGPSEKKDTSLQDIKDKGTIVFGALENNSPMSFYDRTNEITGYDIALMKEIASKLEVDLEVKVISESQADLKDIDIINVNKLANVKSDSLLSTKYNIENKAVILTRKDFLEAEFDGNSENQTIADPKNKEEAVLKLGLSEYDTLVIDELFATYIVVNRPGEFKILKNQVDLESENVGLFVKSEDVLLKEEIDKIITTLSEEGTIKKLSNEWFGNGKDFSI